MGSETTQPERRRSWDGLLRREVAVECRVINQEERSVEIIASTETLDSHGDIVKQHWDLSRFKKNGPILWNHNIHESSRFSFGGAVRPEDTMPVGKGENARVESGQLICKAVLVKGTAEEEPLVDKLWRRIQQGVIKAVSVGFRPGDITRILKADGNTDHFEIGSPERPNELAEISFVPMGSNPEAVAKSIAWERENLGRVAAQETAPRGEETETMAMTDEEKRAFEDLRTKATTAEGRVTALTTELDTEKSAHAKTTTDLAAASKRATDAEEKLVEGEISKLVGVKITPAEKEEEIACAKAMGLDRVLKRLAARPDIKLLAPVEVEGKAVATTEQKAAPSTEPAKGGDAGADIVKTANAAMAQAG